MTFEELKELRDERRTYWDDLRENNPEEYKRKREELEPVYDRWQSETDALTEEESPN
ncbi:MAG: hypothetical protein LBQ22_05645 [Bacteroidales bacterium]|jgi:hypothetical protein|nr:hypothetical protein [Bacteroidales bacterium]